MSAWARRYARWFRRWYLTAKPVDDEWQPIDTVYVLVIHLCWLVLTVLFSAWFL